MGEGSTLPKNKVLKITTLVSTKNNFDVLNKMTEGHIQLFKVLASNLIITKEELRVEPTHSNKWGDRNDNEKASS